MSVKLFKFFMLLTIAIVGFVRAVYDVRIETFNKIEGDTETLMEFNWRLVGRYHLLNGTLINHVDFDDTYRLVGMVEGFVNGEWKPSPINGRVKMCEFMNGVYEKYFESSFQNSTMPKGKDKCPFKKGEYSVNNVDFESDNWAPYAGRGLNKLTFCIMKDNITYGGFVATGLLIDRSI